MNEKELLLMAGIAAGRRWNITPGTRIREIPPGVSNWYIPLASGGLPDSSAKEEIKMESYQCVFGKIQIGYGPKSDILIFSLPVLL